ncbi:MAG TPA: hypothetical protein PK816_13765 [Candidatus Cloacimonadota bacterium]|jgi:hypothetical protein|nr:hypothetical protein [Candidatus Cloacimonadota bacterium]
MKIRIQLLISTFFLITTLSTTIISQEHNQFFWINNQNNNFESYICQDLESDCMWFCLRWTNYYAKPKNEKIHIKTVPANTYPWRLSGQSEPAANLRRNEIKGN